VGLAGRGPGHPGGGGARGGPGHAHGHTPQVAGGPLPGDPSRGQGGEAAELWWQATLLLFQPRLPGGGPADRDPAGGALREPPRRGRLPDRQRVRLPRHRALLLPPLPGGLSGLAGQAVWGSGGPQRGLGHGLLEPALPGLRRGGASPPHRGRAQPQPPPGLLPLRLGPGEGLQPPSGGGPEGPRPGKVRHPQLHGVFHRPGPLRPGRGPGLRQLGQLPPGLHRPDAPLPGGEGAMGPHRPPRRGRLSPRSLPRGGAGAVLDHGAAAGPGELGPPQPEPRPRDGAALDLGGPGPRGGGGGLLPLAAGALRPGADARRAQPSRLRPRCGLL
jgi:hypothetical protein